MSNTPPGAFDILVRPRQWNTGGGMRGHDKLHLALEFGEFSTAWTSEPRVRVSQVLFVA